MIRGVLRFEVVRTWDPSPGREEHLKNVSEAVVEIRPELVVIPGERGTDQISSDSHQVWVLFVNQIGYEVQSHLS